MDDYDASFNPDELQAQIDLSMALTQELVTSWVPSLNSFKSKSDTDKDLEEYLRRPPRLGVGAPIPESAGSIAREAARLKNKLGGNNRKRPREEGNDKEGKSDNEEEEGKGKNPSSSKITRVDPFSKQKKTTNPMSSLEKGIFEDAVGSGSRTLNGSGGELKPPRDSQNPTTPTSPTLPTAVATAGTVVVGDGPATPTRKKKKRKKKHGPGSGLSETSLALLNGVNVDHSHIPEPKEDLDEWSGLGTTSKDDIVGKSQDKDIDDKTPKLSTIAVSPTRTLPSLPLLNLDGPPGDALSGTSSNPSSPKRKRKRRKKKKPSETKPSD
ncbi:hypothetical protein BD410DRAFT_834107 [Rickenella mellea]|uniref:Uncharacterized protein n=1 Tax=Rickenella mellea TaxID=50990 RepID=A0A4R5XFC2_9AGAM|nr:hypothetical protein BD410DRAFT_834107 [Rickenella mellea]